MPKIRKRTGETEEFNPKKLQRSIELAGVPTDVAKRMSEMVRPSEDMSSEQLRKNMGELLATENPAYSAAYLSTRRLTARGSAEVASGVARVNRDLLSRTGADASQSAKLIIGDRKMDVRIEPVQSVSAREILLNNRDLEQLRAPQGSRIGVRFGARES